MRAASPDTTDSVRLYWIDLLCSDTAEAHYRAILNDEERSRADRFVMAQHRRRWTKCRAQLRLVLAGHCGMPPRDLVFTTVHNGKPVLSTAVGSAAGMAPVPHFNLSHSKDHAVIAISNAGPVGIDVEYLKRRSDWHAVAERFFSEREKADLATLDTAACRRAFYRIWTRKEALIKATGEGLSAQLDSFDVTSRPGDPARISGSRNASYRASDWTLHDICMGSHYVGAVATSPGAQLTEM